MARWSILSNRFSGPRGGSPLEGLSDVHRSQESGFGDWACAFIYWFILCEDTATTFMMSQSFHNTTLSSDKRHAMGLEEGMVRLRCITW